MGSATEAKHTPGPRDVPQAFVPGRVPRLGFTHRQLVSAVIVYRESRFFPKNGERVERAMDSFQRLWEWSEVDRLWLRITHDGFNYADAYAYEDGLVLARARGER